MSKAFDKRRVERTLTTSVEFQDMKLEVTAVMDGYDSPAEIESIVVCNEWGTEIDITDFLEPIIDSEQLDNCLNIDWSDVYLNYIHDEAEHNNEH